MNNAPWPFDPGPRDECDSTPAVELIAWDVRRREWAAAAERCADGMILELSNEAALFLCAHLRNELTLVHGDGSDWHVVREGFASW